eukprot:TRINITY_DN2814_c0_g2_i2.p1 TRINITY_DN2814_c0_g2~~TRINITY_DN2814_c0_g2_i2.p1  ORF type:complete len:388 (-),score=65.94 TRINITY_DN2814_c0_g2_i2:120-1283(-)
MPELIRMEGTPAPHSTGAVLGENGNGVAEGVSTSSHPPSATPLAKDTSSAETVVKRTKDVHIEEDVTFADLLLSPLVYDGLTAGGFHTPSPIQLQCIPLGRFGVDIIAQAKSGTGKTIVFSVVSLETIDISNNLPQVLILAPTREVAVQICDVVNTVGQCISGLACHCFIGGLSVSDDMDKLKSGCHIVVGTPGRVKQLIETGAISTSSLRAFVLDEADKLYDESFRDVINWIHGSLPHRKQTIAFSATYTDKLLSSLKECMNDPQIVNVCTSTPTLLGVRQYYIRVDTAAAATAGQTVYDMKTDELYNLLSRLSFHQCVVFTRNRKRAQTLSEALTVEGWTSMHISGQQNQKERLRTIQALRDVDVRVLVSTDLVSTAVCAGDSRG